MKTFALIIMLIAADGSSVVALQPSHTDGLKNVRTMEACDAIAQAQELRMLLSLSSGNGIYKDVSVFCMTKDSAQKFIRERSKYATSTYHYKDRLR